MPNKLQELTDKLYQEGLSKGKEDALRMIEKAKAESATIIADAKKEGERIVAEAKKEAEELSAKINNDLKMASMQSISAIKQQVESSIITKSISTPIKEAISDSEFVKSLILTIVKAFNASQAEPMSLSMILPEKMKGQLASFLENEIKAEMRAGVDVSFSKHITGGFKIGPKDGGYIISFTDGDFEKIISEYLRPATKKVLFGQ